MFYLTYLRQELTQRLGRTIFTVCGLAVGVALVVAVMALSSGVRRAQSQVLGPLAAVGTDMSVTKGAGAGGFGVPLEGAPTNVSELGEPGEAFSIDTFFVSQAPFSSEELETIAGIDGVGTTSRGLQLRGVHQEGTVPQAGAPPEEEGERPTLTDEEQRQLVECLSERGPGRPQPGEDALEGVFSGIGECLPESFRRVTGRINAGQFTIAGVDMGADIGLVSPDQVTSGRFLAGPGEVLVSETYAASRELQVGGELTLEDTPFRVVGLTKPPITGDATDIHVPIADLQALVGLEDRANVVLVRAADAAVVDDVSGAIEGSVPGAVVAGSADLAERVSGSLVDSGDLIRRLGLALGTVAMIASVLIAALLTLSSVAKRTRELGTLKAIGWGPRLVVRQIVAESAAQGVLGAVLGVTLGVGAAALLGVFAPMLSARTTGSADGAFGLGGLFGDPAASEAIRLTAPVSPWAIVLAALLAVLGGLSAGAVGAMRAARLRPADAMREVA